MNRIVNFFYVLMFVVSFVMINPPIGDTNRPIGNRYPGHVRLPFIEFPYYGK